MLAANAVYEELYGEPGQEGQGQAAIVLPATFQVSGIIHLHNSRSQISLLKNVRCTTGLAGSQTEASLSPLSLRSQM